MEIAGEATISFGEVGYAVLRKLVPQAVSSFLYEYALKSERAGRLIPGDSGVPGTPCLSGDPFMDSLLQLLLPSIEAETGRRLLPTYSYFRIYKQGDILKRHQDRPSCEISATLNLGYEAREAWPIWIEIQGEAKAISLEAGDAMLYKGIEVPHWREQFHGERSVQVFLHYVDQDGPHKNFKYDGRAALSASPICINILEQL